VGWCCVLLVVVLLLCLLLHLVSKQVLAVQQRRGPPLRKLVAFQRIPEVFHAVKLHLRLHSCLLMAC
jgi:hypothetical protein